MTLFSSVATLFLSIAVVTIALLQWRVAENKLRLDLFDRRYKVYDATRKFLAVILRDATFTDSQLFEFYGGTSDTEFLFRSEVVDYLAQIRKRALHMRTSRTLLEPKPVGDERSRLAEAEHDDLVWLTDQITAMTSVFAPYLGFANVRLRAAPIFKDCFLRSANRRFQFHKRGQLFIRTHKRAASRSFVYTEQLQHEWDRR